MLDLAGGTTVYLACGVTDLRKSYHGLASICCGCLWEFKYPDFPAKGFVRKFADGIYHQKEIGKHEY